MRKFLARAFLGLLLAPSLVVDTLFAATTAAPVAVPGSQINIVAPTTLPQTQATVVPNTQSLLSEQLTYVRSNMDAQAQWFVTTAAFLVQVSDYILKVTPEKTDAAQIISTYSAALQKLGNDLKAREQVIPVEQAMVLSGFGLHLLAESLVLAATTLQEGTSSSTSFFFPSMSLLGQSLRSVGDNIAGIGVLAMNNGGNIDIAQYQAQMDAAVFLYQALQNLSTNRDQSGGTIKADLKSSQAAKASNSTYQVIHFDASDSSDSLGTIATKDYFWDFGDGTFAFGPYVSHTYTKATTYLVKLMVKGPSGFSAVTSEVKVTPVVPVAIIITDQDSILGPIPDELVVTANEPVTFSGLSSYDPTPGSQLKLVWDFGDGKTDSGVDNGVVSHTYTVAGNYTLVLRAENGQFVGVTQRKIRVISAPPDIKLQIRSATQTNWSNSNKHFFTQPFFGATSLDFTAQESSGAVVAGFNARTQLVKAEWDFGDGSEPLLQSQNQLAAKEKVSHTYEKAGIYTVTLRVTDDAQNIGEEKKTVILSDAASPAADFDFFGEIPLTTASQQRFDASASTTPQGSISQYNWRIVSAANELVYTSSLKSFIYSFPKPGKYQVSLQVTTNLGAVSNRVSEDFYVLSSAPQAAFTYTYDPYVPNKMTFDAKDSSDPDQNDVLSYSWDFNNDGLYEVTGSRSPQFTQVLDKIGSNIVRLQVSDSAGLTSEATQTVSINSLLVSTMQVKEGTQAIGNAPFTVQLVGAGFRSLATRHDTNSITEFVWDFGDGSAPLVNNRITQGVAEQSHTYSTPGRYLVTLKVRDAEGEEAISAYPIHVGDGADPIASIFYTPSYPLAGDTQRPFLFDGSKSVNVSGKNTNLQYSWDFGDNSPLADGPKVTHLYKTPGVYTVTLTVTDTVASRINRVQVQAEVKTIPAFARLVVGPLTGVAPLTVQFDASSSTAGTAQIKEYRYEFGDGQTSVSAQPQVAHIYKTAGTYKVKVTIRSVDGSESTSPEQTIVVTQ